MKKILTIFTAIIAVVITLTACSVESKISPDSLELDNAYRFVADIRYGEGFSAAGQFERKSASVWEITLTEPFALTGKTLKYEQGNITAQFEGLENNNISGDLHSFAPYKRIIDVFEHAISGDGRTVVSSGERITISSRAGTPTMPYELALDKSTLSPLTLTIADASITVEFSDVQMSQIVSVILP